MSDAMIASITRTQAPRTQAPRTQDPRTQDPRTEGRVAPRRRCLKVGGTECSVRAARICSIPEVLGLEEAMDIGLGGLPGEGAVEDGVLDSRTVIDLLDSRMIVPPRPRRRRERAFSSRAVFFGG